MSSDPHLRQSEVPIPRGLGNALHALPIKGIPLHTQHCKLRALLPPCPNEGVAASLDRTLVPVPREEHVDFKYRRMIGLGLPSE